MTGVKPGFDVPAIKAGADADAGSPPRAEAGAAVGGKGQKIYTSHPIRWPVWLDRTDLPLIQRVIYGRVLSFPAGTCRLQNASLAAFCGVQELAVKRALAALEAVGLIERRVNRGGIERGASPRVLIAHEPSPADLGMPNSPKSGDADLGMQKIRISKIRISEIRISNIPQSNKVISNKAAKQQEIEDTHTTRARSVPLTRGGVAAGYVSDGNDGGAAAVAGGNTAAEVMAAGIACGGDAAVMAAGADRAAGRSDAGADFAAAGQGAAESGGQTGPKRGRNPGNFENVAGGQGVDKGAALDAQNLAHGRLITELERIAAERGGINARGVRPELEPLAGKLIARYGADLDAWPGGWQQVAATWWAGDWEFAARSASGAGGAGHKGRRRGYDAAEAEAAIAAVLAKRGATA